MKYLTAVVTLAFLFSGCESGYSDRNSGIEGTGSKVDHASAAYGTVSGFGSIYVNGVHFDTATAEVEIDGTPAREEDLAIGMVVEVEGTFDPNKLEGSANAVRAKRVLLGKIDEVNNLGWGRKSIQLLGQTVFINEDASFNGIEFDNLQPGQGLSVSGFVSNAGLITASYVASKNIQDHELLEIEGYIESFDADSKTLQIKNLIVNVSNAQFESGNLQNLIENTRVHIKGTTVNNSPFNGYPEVETTEFEAQEITFLSTPDNNNSYVSIEGIIQELTSSSQLTVRDTTVDFSNAQIEFGSSDDLQQNVQIIVSGKMQQEILIADLIFIKSFDTRRFSGTLQLIDAENNSFTLNNTQFNVTELTHYQDDSSSQDRYFNFSDLRTGEDLEVYSVKINDSWKATKIIKRDADLGRPFWISGEANLMRNSTDFMVDHFLVDGSDLSDSEWQSLRDERDPIRVNVEGYYTGPYQFKATRVFIMPDYKCDPRIFYCDYYGPDPFFDKHHF